MKVAVIAETDADEPRVAATPETVKKMVALGATVAVQAGAGVKSGVLDADYAAAGASVTADAVQDADIVLQVRRPEAAELSHLKKGAIVRLDLSTLTGGAPAEARWWLKPKGARAKGLPLQGKAKAGKEPEAAKGQHGRKKKRREKRVSPGESARAAVLETHQPFLGGADA